MFFYHVPDPDEAMLISGGKHKAADDQAAPFKVIVGHGAFVPPVFRSSSFIDLSQQEAVIKEDCITTQGITCAVEAVVAFKVGNDVESITNAATRFLGDQANDRMQTLAGQIFAGHLRSIVGSMRLEDIIRNRQELAANVLDASKVEMGHLGLIIDSFQISRIDDKNSGYIDSLSAPHRANAQRDAQIAEAQAAQASAEAQQESQRKQAEFARDTQLAQAQYARDTQLAQAGYEAETQAKQQEAAQAGPLASAKAQQAVLSEQSKVALKNAELTQANLLVTQIRPAEAAAQKTKIDAEAAAEARRVSAAAEAEATRLTAEAAASSDRVALDQRLIELLPQIVSSAAQGLAGSNLTVLNGTEGINELFTQLLSQGLSVLGTMKSGIRESVDAARSATSD